MGGARDCGGLRLRNLVTKQRYRSRLLSAALLQLSDAQVLGVLVRKLQGLRREALALAL